MLDLAKDTLAKNKDKKVLLLGLAGGTMVQLLGNVFADIEITAIEIDSVLIDINIMF